MEIAKILVGATSGIARNRMRIPTRAAGLTVSVVFTDTVWDTLTKTVVFRGTGSRIAEFDGKTAVIPWEVLLEPNTRVYFGIYGTDSKTGVQLPLIEVDIGSTERSTDPQADPGADPTLPIWAQLDDRVSRLERSGTGGTVSPEEIQKAVEDYLEENPPAAASVTINGEEPDENGNFIINTVSDVEIASLRAALT